MKIAFENANNTNNLIRIKHEDYAVMEKSNIVKVIPSNISWSDALYEDENHIAIDSSVWK